MTAHERDPRDWKKPSRAVIAFATSKSGLVLWFVGAHVEAMIEMTGTHDVDGLGFELVEGPATVTIDRNGHPFVDFPPGISVWEGRMSGGGYNAHTGDYNDCYLKGTCRSPTDAEWARIRAGQNPWNANDWLVQQ
jgi:hypothetical protein